jgi:RNase P subunit RPR2
MKNDIKISYCVKCGAGNDINVSFLNNIKPNEWAKTSAYVTCWYCKEQFRWEIKNEYYEK